LVRRDTGLGRALDSNGLPPELPEEVIRAPAQECGEFLLLSLVGTGGVGEVWKAWDKKLRRFVAIKFIVRGTGDDRRRLVREAQVAARVKHPSIVTIHGVGDSPRGPFIVMEYVDGVTLERATLSLRQKCTAIRDAARAIHEAHREGIIHRDLKPQNILVVIDSVGAVHVHVTDFGLAKQLEAESSVSASGIVLGTPGYMSPEQASGRSKQIGPRSDVYSLGATLYHLTTGHPPFDGTEFLELLRKIEYENPPSPRTRNPKIPREVEIILGRAMEKEIAGRYASAEALAEDLQRWLEGDPIRARPPRIGAPLWKRIRKHPRTFSFFSASLLVIVVFLIGWRLLENRRSERESRRALGEARERVARREWTHAIEILAPHLARHPKDPEALHLRAECVRALEEEKSVATRLLDALLRDLAETHQEALRRRRAGESARVLREIPNRILESALYREVRGQAEQDARVRSSLGRLYRIVGDDRRAIDHQEAAIALDRGLASAQLELAHLRFREYQRLYLALSRTWQRDASRKRFQLVGVHRGSTRPVDIENNKAREYRLAAQRHLGLALSGLKKGSVDESTARGLSAFIDKQRETAILEFRRAVEMDRGCEDAVLYLSSLLETQGEIAAALQVLTGGIEADAGNVVLLVRRGGTQVRMADGRGKEDLESEKRLRTAIADFTRALQLDPEHGEARFGRVSARLNLTSLLMRRGSDPALEFRDTLVDLEILARQDPESREVGWHRAQLWMAWAEYHENRDSDPVPSYRQTIRTFDDAIRLDRANVVARILRGKTWTNLGLRNRRNGIDPLPFLVMAIQDFQEAIQLNWRDSEAFLGRAHARSCLAGARREQDLDASADMEASLRDFQVALELEPGNYEALLLRGDARNSWGTQVHLRDQDPTSLYRAALVDLERAMHLSGGTVGHALLGRTWRNLGLWIQGCEGNPALEYAQSELAYAGAIRKNPGDFRGFMGRGDTRLNWGVFKEENAQDPTVELERAIIDFGEAIRLNPNDFEPWMSRANATGSLLVALTKGLAETRSTKEELYRSILKDFGVAASRNPNHGEIYLRRAYYHTVMGRYADSLPDFERGARLSPGLARSFRKYWVEAREKTSQKDR